MAVAWLSAFFAQVEFLWKGQAQPRDYRVNFRDGFKASQVDDGSGNGINVLTYDVDLANIDENATNSTVVVRTATGGIKAKTINGTGFTFESARHVRFVMPVSPLSLTGLTLKTGTGSVQTTTTTPQAVLYNEALGLIHGAVWVQTVVRVFPASGHVLLPATFPLVKIWAVDEDENMTRIDVSSSSPTFGNVGAYEAGGYNITVTIGNHTIDLETNRYIVEVYDEVGGGAIAGLDIARISWEGLEASL